jgi:hypothetical protein
MRRAATFVVGVVGLVGLWPLGARAELALLVADGSLHLVALDGRDLVLPERYSAPRALAALDGDRLAVVHGEALTVLGTTARVVPGRWGDVRALAGCGSHLYAAVDGEVVEITLPSGRRRSLARLTNPGPLACDGDAVLVAHDQAVEQLGGPRWPAPGRALALAAGGGRVFVATREGPLWQIDRASARRRDLGLGGWWGTRALATDGTRVYAATQAGKLWEIDVARLQKTIVSMSGWEAALALAITTRRQTR